MLVVVVLIFGVCWLPYHLYFIYAYLDPDVTYTTWAQPLYLAIYWLAMSNCMYNPFIYYWMNSSYGTFVGRDHVLGYIANYATRHTCDLRLDATLPNICHRTRVPSETATTDIVIVLAAAAGAISASTRDVPRL
ncbi:tachykinin peptides receptor 86C-like [Tropilaelaps mercedesae]|uniref:Tachykinin peptides receptor 86C-like n=1 Tax=Tropilaelaps mercedesae TaxID=418985 RepID=A0A1V9XFD7_9ACAR|nr:tachykinin peptides receptor 86C-like [Tropilaelaps mercedesae]